MLAELGQRIERARLARDLTQRELAEQAGVGKRTLERIEAGESTTTTNLVRLLRALDALDLFDALGPSDEGPSPWEELRHARRGRRRASGSRAAPRSDVSPRLGEGFLWGDEEPG